MGFISNETIIMGAPLVLNELRKYLNEMIDNPGEFEGINTIIRSANNETAATTSRKMNKNDEYMHLKQFH